MNGCESESVEVLGSIDGFILGDCEFDVCVVSDGVGLGIAFLTMKPLLQTNFFPDLMQVYFFALYIFVLPCVEQMVPVFGGAAE